MASEKFNRAPFPEIVVKPVRWEGTERFHSAHNYKALVDANTGKLFSIVSKNYKVIRHESAIDVVEKTINEHPELGAYRFRTGFYNDGGRMRRTYRFTEMPFKIAENDEVYPELHLFNSYDYSWPFIVLLGGFSVVCTNGLVVGKKFLHIRKRHVWGIEELDVSEQVSTALERFFLQTEQWRKWADQPLAVSVYVKVMEAMKLGKGAVKQIENRMASEATEFDRDGFPIMSVWVFFNVLTWYITHRAVSLNHRVELEKRLRKAITNFKGEA
ncbi:MAG: DUF932 domain-containing protein [Desulfobacteraceae bacterium]|nr:MAG: DUF932 domain-containing protein [Desulfobacteraceae bacterium]